MSNVIQFKKYLGENLLWNTYQSFIQKPHEKWFPRTDLEKVTTLDECVKLLDYHLSNEYVFDFALAEFFNCICSPDFNQRKHIGFNNFKEAYNYMLDNLEPSNSLILKAIDKFGEYTVQNSPYIFENAIKNR